MYKIQQIECTARTYLIEWCQVFEPDKFWDESDWLNDKTNHFSSVIRIAAAFWKDSPVLNSPTAGAVRLKLVGCWDDWENYPVGLGCEYKCEQWRSRGWNGTLSLFLSQKNWAGDVTGLNWYSSWRDADVIDGVNWWRADIAYPTWLVKDNFRAK